jgi:hypothetical protein
MLRNGVETATAAIGADQDLHRDGSLREDACARTRRIVSSSRQHFLIEVVTKFPPQIRFPRFQATKNRAGRSRQINP